VDLIRLSQPQTSSLEREYVCQALASKIWHGDGSFTERATSWLVERTGTPAALLTTSCTHALELAAMLLDLGPGDEVICPAFTFTSTVTAVAIRGATPVLVDIDPVTLNLDVERVAEAITPRTKGVFVVHYGGVAADLDGLMSLLQPLGIPLVEDNAHGIGAYWKGQHLGTFGVVGAQSWHDTKNIGCGEGGALLVNDAALLDRAEIIREKGTNRRQFLRGDVDKYTWTDHGSSYLMSDVSAALLLAQMERFDEIQTARHGVWSAYHHGLAEWAALSGVQRVAPVPGSEHPAHLYWLMMPGDGDQAGLIRHLRERNIVAAFHYQALDESEAGRRLARTPWPCQVSRRAARRLVRLPLHADLTAEDVDQVIEAVTEYVCESAPHALRLHRVEASRLDASA
jgi:dTDP-4-amino-4,6-dideoxygalactose transaminase